MAHQKRNGIRMLGLLVYEMDLYAFNGRDEVWPLSDPCHGFLKGEVRSPVFEEILSPFRWHAVVFSSSWDDISLWRADFFETLL